MNAERAAEFGIVVDLAVGDQDHAVGRDQRLGAAGDVDDREPCVYECYAVLDIAALSVGAAMVKGKANAP